MTARNVVIWDEVQSVAASAFSIWCDQQAELEFAQRAWNVLIEKGFASFSTEKERGRVCIRFLALAGIYHDFCRMAWEESPGIEYDYWADELGLSSFRIGQLIGEDAECDPDGDDDEATEEALQHLIHASRSTVLRVLRDGFGGPDALFVALWRSNRPALINDDDSEETVDLTESEILNDVTPDKMVAYEWLQEECSALSPETECL